MAADGAGTAPRADCSPFCQGRSTLAGRASRAVGNNRTATDAHSAISAGPAQAARRRSRGITPYVASPSDLIQVRADEISRCRVHDPELAGRDIEPGAVERNPA